MVPGLSILTTALKGISVVSRLGSENHRLQGHIKGKLHQLLLEVTLAYEGAEELTLQMQELLYDIEDFIYDLCIPEKPEALVHHMAGTDSRPEVIARIESFLESIEIIRKRQEDYSKGGNANNVLPGFVLPASPTPYAPEKNLEGFPKTKIDFLELLSPSPAHTGQRRVISIVGCSGLGKTALARAAYDANPLRHKAWVVASSCNNATDLVNKVLSQVREPDDSESDTSLQKVLHNERYLVIVDDLRSDGVQWKDIEHEFPKNDKDSRIIVTTRVHSIARGCSSGSYYVYPMQCLGEANSKGLFWKKFFGPDFHRMPSDTEVDRSENILAKCDGLPLALISAGNYLPQKDVQPYMSADLYKGVCEELNNLAASDKAAFREIKRMFLQCYNSLTNYDEKKCLLYLSIYPRGHQINSKSVVRRLQAEELIAGDVLGCLKKLIDKSMIEPSVPIRNSSNVAKNCQVQGMMLEFIVHKSRCRNFVTVVDGGMVRHNKDERKDLRQTTGCSTVRRLTVRSSSSKQDLIPDGIRMSSVRSLTIFKSKLFPETRVDFKSCRMMRVLDLEGCQGLNKSSCIVDDICELPFLKYLSLRNTDVDELRPTKVKNLKHLEVLDIRQTSVTILPVEVVMLPELAYLFGEFELPMLAHSEKIALTRFLKEESKLHTLAGIIINNKTQGFPLKKGKTQCFQIVILHAKKMKKIKICSKDRFSASASSHRGAFAFWGFRKQKQHYGYSKLVPQPPPDGKLVGVLVSSLQERLMDLESISIDSSVISEAFLGSDLKANSCIISSIKLRGALTSLLACKLKDLRNLTRLHLFSTGLSSSQLVEALQNMDRLEYLKLGEEDCAGSWDGDFSVESGGFRALRELCFIGPREYPRLKIAQEAMSILASLQLLCWQSTPCVTRVEGIEHLRLLEEVILHHSADDATIQAWKEAAKTHISMPCVKKLPA